MYPQSLSISGPPPSILGNINYLFNVCIVYGVVPLLPFPIPIYNIENGSVFPAKINLRTSYRAIKACV
jgi:hypothetical protein